MTRWDYIQVTNPNDDDCKNHTKSGEWLPEKRGLSLLNRLGVEGWELITSQLSWDGLTLTYAFKRPVP